MDSRSLGSLGDDAIGIDLRNTSESVCYWLGKAALPRKLWSQNDTMRLGKKLSRHATQTGTDNHKQIAERGVGKKSVSSVDPKRLASDKVLYGDCHMCLAFFPRRGDGRKKRFSEIWAFKGLYVSATDQAMRALWRMQLFCLQLEASCLQWSFCTCN